MRKGLYMLALYDCTCVHDIVREYTILYPINEKKREERTDVNE